MTLKECYKVLELNGSSDLAEVKKAYRRLAFLLHPDLNPDVPEASRRFQQLNEAYVVLSQTLASEEAKGRARKFGRKATDSAKAREDAQKAYKKAREQTGTSTGFAEEFSDGKFAEDPKQEEEKVFNKEEILKDILNDPFARRVFEDIYSHIKQEPRPPKPETRKAGPVFSSARTTTNTRGGANANRSGNSDAAKAKNIAEPVPSKTRKPITPGNGQADQSGIIDGIKGWLRRQIDDEQELRLPGEQLVPGGRILLKIQHGLTAEQQTIELTLPPGFTPGKTMRLKGMGKRVGNWRGDLYVRIVSA